MGLKFRNKKTGEIADLDDWTLTGANDCITIESDHDIEKGYNYKSLAEFLEEWEDYKPKEPLIKDEGAREVMRLWAKVNLIPTNAATIEYHFADSLCGKESEFWDNNLHIMFHGKIAPNAVHGEIYTIDELCGEEEG